MQVETLATYVWLKMTFLLVMPNDFKCCVQSSGTVCIAKPLWAIRAIPGL